MAERRAVITGIGCITPIGTGVQSLWEGVQRGKSAIERLRRFDPGVSRSRIAAQIDDFDPLQYLDKKRAHRMDRFSQFAVIAGFLALADAGLRPETMDRERVGICMGSALGGVAFAEEQYRKYFTDGHRAVAPTLGLSVFGGAASCNMAIQFGFTGPNETNAMSCASGAVALGRALGTIRRGEADVVMAGGSEAPLAPLCFGAFDLLRAMSARNDAPSQACRPFDRNRDGFVMGEGAAVLIIEDEAHARARKARIYAELAGFGLTNDAHHMSAPLPGGGQAARAMRLAMAEAGLSATDIGYINAHGSSTILNDVTEAKAIRSVIGNAPVPVSGTKSLYGHPLGASGAIEAAITSLALYHRWLPPTTNLEEPDAEVDLDLITGAGRAAAPNAALSNSFGFGGVNATLAFRRG